MRIKVPHLRIIRFAWMCILGVSTTALTLWLKPEAGWTDILVAAGLLIVVALTGYMDGVVSERLRGWRIVQREEISKK